jgi:hypothetical protein
MRGLRGLRSGFGRRFDATVLRLVACAALVALLGAVGGCEVEGDHTGFRDWQVKASVTSNGAPQSGVDVQVWIVNVDADDESRTPIEMEPVTTDAQGEATWTYNSVGEPYICGYEVRELSGTLLVRNEPLVWNELSFQGNVEIDLP